MESQLDELYARMEIADALHRFCDGVDRMNPDLIRSAYHEDAYDDHGPISGGVDEFVDIAMSTLKQNMATTSHRITNIQIQRNGNVAAVQSYVEVVHVLPGGANRPFEWFGGRYLDRFELRASQWKIVHRTLVIDWHAEIDTRPVSSHMLYHSGARDSGDPWYRLLESVLGSVSKS